VRRYEDPSDREVVALLASSLAYGRVGPMIRAIDRVVDALGTSPAATIDRSREAPKAMERLLADARVTRYRFTRPEQIASLLVGAARVRRERGSLEDVLLRHDAGDSADLAPALSGFIDDLRLAAPSPPGMLLSSPADGSACKRHFLMLRWMVRLDAIDPGGWSRCAPSRLLVPLDVHLGRVARARGWTKRRTNDLISAREITDALRQVDSRDPVRFDFSLTRGGIRRSPTDS